MKSRFKTNTNPPAPPLSVGSLQIFVKGNRGSERKLQTVSGYGCIYYIQREYSIRGQLLNLFTVRNQVYELHR